MKKLVVIVSVLIISLVTVVCQTTAGSLFDTTLDKTLLTTEPDSPTEPPQTYWERFIQNDNPWTWEFTLGGGGVTVDNETEFGLDFSISTNPFKWPVWIGIVESFYWEPKLVGSTDIFVDWSVPLYKDVLCLNIGWSAGCVYGDIDSEIWRTGPETTLQWYVTESTYIYSGVNYDAFISRGDSEIRYGLGFGLSF